MPIDMSLAAKAPPRKATTSGTPRSRLAAAPPDARTVNDKRTEGLLGLAQLGQGICLMTGLYADAAALGQHFPPVAKELANIADGSEMLAKPIDLLIEVGPYGALVAAAMPLALQIMANHGIVDASRMMGQGVVPPEVLEAQMKAEMAKMQADAMRMQQEAMEAAQRSQRQYEALMEKAAA